MSTSASATDFWATLVWIMTPRFDYEILYNCTDSNSQPASSLMLCALLIIANYSSHGPYAEACLPLVAFQLKLELPLSANSIVISSTNCSVCMHSSTCVI